MTRNPICDGEAVAPPASAATVPVTVRVDASQPQGELAPIWRFFGADEPNYAYMKDGRKLLASLGELKPRAVYFRTHNLLTSGDGTPDAVRQNPDVISAYLGTSH